jgi:catechol 2,3-dioxygenase-like lactoylglutathione lyase family enzyme
MTTPGTSSAGLGNRQACIVSTIPILASLNLAESIEFYTARLGFELMARFDGYAIVGRDGCELHFHACDNALIAQNTSCYLRTPSTEALYQEFISRGANLKPPEARAWGMKEMYVWDPHGNLLKFGEHL